MRSDLIRDLFRHLDADGSLQVGNCGAGANRTLEELSLPISLKRVLQWYWTNGGGTVGPYTLYSIEGALSDEDFPRLLSAAMIPIGYAQNGDPLVLRFGDEWCEVGLISHDQFWADGGDALSAYSRVAGSIEEYLWRAAEGHYLPVDSLAASELIEMQTDINSEGIKNSKET